MKRQFEITPDLIRQTLGYDAKDKIKLSKERTITTLWAGYGTVSRLTVSSLSNHVKQVLVIKRVVPPSKDDFDSIGNQRKLKSYMVEAAFYKEIAPILLCNKIMGEEDSGVTASPVSFPTIARPYSIQMLEEEEGHAGGAGPSFCFILSDLSERYNQSYRSSDVGQVKAAIKWLAAFHSRFYRCQTMSKRNKRNGETIVQL